jgi:hypothetical protein
MNFLYVEQSVRELKRQVNAGEIDQKTFKARLLELVDVGDDGYYWMFGHNSEVWYRHDGQQWIPDSPGELLMPLELSSNHGGKTVNHQSISYLHVPQEIPEIDWDSIDVGWFIAALAFLIFISLTVYLSAPLDFGF